MAFKAKFKSEIGRKATLRSEFPRYPNSTQTDKIPFVDPFVLPKFWDKKSKATFSEERVDLVQHETWNLVHRKCNE